ncbi:Cytoplasmic tRNA 2-thiolation protein 2 [Lucilia cuprina]|uniref:Cytoplasmic tRNA 2-thiolation protein 2 n=1 Tax=Lucilia cuprina TaxID=7375 RepID=A0A0L0CK98_LUCCU|nr:Cytoplasmic tRNA 2-thiolation protein 2 [Lucilia cuprina]
MCSIGEDDFGDEGGVHAMIPDIKPQLESNLIEEQLLCNKCKKPGAIYKLPFRQAECRECFLLYARHKFRAALGSSKVLPKDAKVILVFDGSAESLVLLDMLHHAQTQNTFKRLHCTATVLYIDDYQLLHQDGNENDYLEFLEKMQILLKQYTHFESYIVPLVEQQEVERCLLNFNCIKEQNYHLLNQDQKQSFLCSINSIKSLTSRQDFVKHHRSKLIAAVAKHFDSKFAFMSDISSDLATDLLAAVALGRGGSAALDVALVDDRLGNDIKLIRPLKDLNTSEIELYLKAQDIQILLTKRYGLEMGSTASLQNLTKAFVDNLQQNFSATVSTVFRTGDKIAVNRDVVKQLEALNMNGEDDNLAIKEKCCSFCNSFLDYQDSNTLLAIEFSRLVSESGCTLDKCPDLNAKATVNVSGSAEKPYLKNLCHACRNICLESKNKNLLL